MTRDELLWSICFSTIARHLGVIPALIIANTFVKLEIEVV